MAPALPEHLPGMGRHLLRTQFVIVYRYFPDSTFKKRREIPCAHSKRRIAGHGRNVVTSQRVLIFFCNGLVAGAFAGEV
jgi:hypothetical protein